MLELHPLNSLAFSDHFAMRVGAPHSFPVTESPANATVQVSCSDTICRPIFERWSLLGGLSCRAGLLDSPECISGVLKELRYPAVMSGSRLNTAYAFSNHGDMAGKDRKTHIVTLIVLENTTQRPLSSAERSIEGMDVDLLS